jgi:polar amino acid transport system substrate-binding protein
MKTLTKILGTAALALTMGANVAVADLKIGVAAENYPPFTVKGADGQWTGFEVDFMNAICEAMNEKCTIVEVSWDGIIPALLGKKFDGIISSMSITEERLKTINFSDKYYNTPAVLVAGKSMNVMADDVSGKIIGVQTSTTHSNYAEKHLSAGKVKMYATFDEHNQDLVAGRVDAVVGDSIAFQDFLGSDAGSDYEVKAELNDDAVFGPGVGVGMRKEDTELAAKVNAAIKTIRDNGSYEAFSKTYFDFDVFGG